MTERKTKWLDLVWALGILAALIWFSVLVFQAVIR